MKFKYLSIAFVMVFLLTACGTTGKDFSLDFVKHIKSGETSKHEIVQELGEPNRTGITNGDKWWIYEYNTYKFGKSYSKDLSLTFDNQGVVQSYNFSSNFPKKTSR